MMDETEEARAISMQDERLIESVQGTITRRQLERGVTFQNPCAASGTLYDQTNEPVAPALPTQQLRK
jgi:hypothetical protein